MPPARKKFWRVYGQAGIKEDINVVGLVPDPENAEGWYCILAGFMDEPDYPTNGSVPAGGEMRKPESIRASGAMSSLQE